MFDSLDGVMLASVPVRGDLVLERARLVDDDALATKLENAYGRGVKLLALEIAERRDDPRRAPDAPPPGLEELRGALLQEREWRVREGLQPR